ncbi:MAG: 4'-phosphopantetheinyl transferase superfamily protein [Treponemataceae bacterium]|nr:4'-phosphopantetheinyl transferase superfamily protein [Treponemataceae bacterium]
MTKLYPNMTYPLDIKHDKSGCPLFADKTLSDLKNKYDINPYFSLSHSGDYGCSVVSENPVGIDIEKMDFEKHDTLEKLAARFFTSEESDWVKDDILRFYEIWCAKEAFLKASGLAGKLPMSGFRAEIVLGAQSAQSSENGEIYIKYDYQFDDNQSNRYIGKILLDKLDEGYMMAVCVRQKADTVIDCKFLVE